MANVIFTNVRIFDGSGAQPYTGEVLVQGNRISRITRGARSMPTAGVHDDRRRRRHADARHGRVAYAFLLERSGEPQRDPAHAHRGAHPVVRAHRQALPRHGIDLVRRAPRPAKPRLDVVDAQRHRQRARSPDRAISPRARRSPCPAAWRTRRCRICRIPEFSFGAIVSGAEEMRKCVRMFLKYGVDTIKLNLSGEYIAGHAGRVHADGRRRDRDGGERGASCAASASPAHARSSESVKQCVRHGIEMIYHASFADEEALDMLEAAKDKHFVAPGIAWLINTSLPRRPSGASRPRRRSRWAITASSRSRSRSLKKMHKRGIRILPGGDYGFAWIPHGTNAKDLEYFVKYLGFTPMEALLAATEAGRPDDAAAATSWARSRRASSPICCWWTAIRWPTSPCCRSASGCWR